MKKNSISILIPLLYLFVLIIITNLNLHIGAGYAYYDLIDEKFFSSEKNLSGDRYILIGEELPDPIPDEWTEEVCCCKDGKLILDFYNIQGTIPKIVCEKEGGTVVYLEGRKSCSEDMCTLQQVNVYKLEINVTDENKNPIKDAIIGIKRYSGGVPIIQEFIETKKTNITGQAEFLLKEGVYQLTIEKEGCTENSIIDLFENKSIEISMNLLECMCRCSPWSDCHMEGGSWIKTRNCVGNCEGIPTSIPCTPPLQNCGNGEIDNGEECDPTASNNPEGCVCNYECKCIYGYCGDGYCGDGEDTTNCPIDCKETPICNLDEITLSVNPFYHKGIKEIGLNIDYDEGCIFVRGEIKRDGSTIYITSDGLKQYIDRFIEPGKYYLYEINITLSNGFEERSYTNDVRIYSGDGPCFTNKFKNLETDETICLGNSIANCDNNNTLITTSCSEQKCVVKIEDGKHTGYCVDEGICEKCNSVLGAYSVLNLYVTYGNNEGSVCEALSDPDIAICFMGPTTTPVNKYYSCDNMDSCYGYNNEESCVEDSCHVSSNGCSWNSDAELCIPNSIEEQECYLCNLREDCNEELCEAYGADCYYGNINGESMCIHKYNMSCPFYRNQEDCNGGRDRYINVQYVNTPSRGNIPISGNNNLIPSNDKFGIGICLWNDTSSQCNRDADNLRPYNDDEIDISKISLKLSDSSPPITNIYIPDSGIEKNGLPVLSWKEINGIKFYSGDKRNRWTNMTGIGVDKTYYTFVGELNIVGEPNIEEEYPRTIYNERVNGDLFRNEIERVSINRHREICCGLPDEILLSLPFSHPKHKPPRIKQTKIKVRYYSKDLSNNLEKIKEEEFIPDITPPTINLFVNSKSYETGNYKLSNLSIRVDTCDFLNIVDCSLNISKLNDNFNIKYAFVNSNSERYKKEVSGLKDGIYKVEVRCSDPLKNINTEEIIKSLDSNFLINNQRPLFDIYGPNKELFIRGICG